MTGAPAGRIFIGSLQIREIPVWRLGQEADEPPILAWQQTEMSRA
jgi:hypothetical protein